MEEELKSKIPLKTVPSDDCVVRIGRVIEGGKIVDQGQEIHIHENEWVKIQPIVNLRQFIALNKITQSALGNSNNLEEGLNELCDQLSKRVVEWNWTDNEFNPLPQPHNNPSVLYDLTEDELIYLVSTLTETKEQQGNAGPPSESS